MTTTMCPITGQPAEKLVSMGDGDEYRSPLMRGRYAISGTAKAILRNRELSEREQARLIEWVIDQRLKGEECPRITSYVLVDEVLGVYS